MDCRQFRELYTDYADEALDEATEIAARRHLALCAGCRRFDAAFHAGLGELRSLPRLQTSPDFDHRLRERILREALDGQDDAGRGLLRLAALAGSVVVVVSLGVAGWELWGSGRLESATAAGASELSPAAPARAVPERSPATARLAHDTSFGHDPFRVLPALQDSFGGTRRGFEITVDWMVP